MTGEVWALSDGAAGNRRQALALANALAAAAGLGPVWEWRLRVRAPWRWLAPRRCPGVWTGLGPEFARAALRPPAVVVGCGRQAALATRLLRERGCRAVQVLDPRLSPSAWDVLVVPEHDRVRGDNVVTCTGGLHEIDDAWLSAGARAFPLLASDPQPRTLLLLGGPIRGIDLGPRWWRTVADTLGDWQARDGGTLWLCGSRRTPARLAQAARSTLAGSGVRCWFSERDGDNPYAGFLANADRIVVSPDSINLVTEACATRVPVYIAFGAEPRVADRGRHGRFLRSLIERGRVRPLRVSAPGWSIEPIRDLPAVVAQVRALLGL